MIINDIDHTKQFIGTVVYGRLGNNLFQIAAGLTWAERFGINYYGFIEDGNVCQYADNFLKRVPFINGVRHYPNCYYGMTKPEFSKYFDLDKPKINCIIKGYLQSEKFIDRDLILRTFEFPENIKRKAYEIYGNLKGYTAIHILRGDHVTLNRTNPNYPIRLLKPEWYKRVMNEFGESERFFIVSDNMGWCKETLKGERILFSDRKACNAESEDALLDLYNLSCCRNHVLSTSSFSWWGSYLCQNPYKKDIFPDPWFNDMHNDEFEDIYPAYSIKSSIKTAICAIVKMENRYIREWVEYHLDLGFDVIYLYDNNEKDGEKLEDVISDYMVDGKVKIISYRGKRQAQKEAYNHCYSNQDFDWCAFIDIDEFFALAQKSTYSKIKDFLVEVEKKGFDVVKINWMLFGDNDLVNYDNRGVIERFQKPIMPLDFTGNIKFPLNYHTKSIVKKGVRGLQWKNVHFPTGEYKVCNDSIEETQKGTLESYKYTNCLIRHYYTKTVEEWIKIRQARVVLSGGNADDKGKQHSLSEFFIYNKPSLEKISFINRIFRYENDIEKTVKDINCNLYQSTIR